MRTETAAFVCSHVFSNTRPILLVARENGDWMYLCGESHGDGEDFQVIGREHLLLRDPSLNGLLDLADGMEAERASPGQPWVRRLLSSE